MNFKESLESIYKKQESDLLGRQWLTTKQKLESLLLSNNILSSQNVREFCCTLESLTLEERIECIRLTFGEPYLAKVMPILQQLETIENAYRNG